MAKGLGVKTCAEGVENWEQFNYLIAVNCDHIQGYLFSKPLSLKDILKTKQKEVKLTKNVVNLKLKS